MTTIKQGPDMLSGRLYLFEYGNGLHALKFALTKDIKDFNFEGAAGFIKWESDIIYSSSLEKEIFK